MAGADAVLLIIAALSNSETKTLLEAAKAYGLWALVEIHNQNELDIALSHGAEIIGINNRDLKSFNVSLETTKHLALAIPKDCVRISESGIHRREEIEELSQYGIDAVLVGSHFMREESPGIALSRLTGVKRK